MASVFGTAKGLTVPQISTFVAAIYTGGLVFQYPIGWISDRMDRRRLILILTAGGAVLTLAGALVSDRYLAILALGFVIGGVANPLYALIIAYTNDFLGHEDMPAASSGLLFINGLGAMTGPFLIGVLMTRFGAGRLLRLHRRPVRADRRLRRLPDDAPRRAAVERALRPGAAAGLGGRGRGGAGGGDRARRARRRAAEAASLSARAPARVAARGSEEVPWTRWLQEVLDFWLRELTPEDWFRGGEALDARIRDRWLPTWERANAGALPRVDGGAEAPASRSSSCSTSSRATSSAAAPWPSPATGGRWRWRGRRCSPATTGSSGCPSAPSSTCRSSIPRRRSTRTTACGCSCSRFGKDHEFLLHARAHREIIRRFGRFPFRNAAFGRESTPEEVAFLEEGGYAAMLKELAA